MKYVVLVTVEGMEQLAKGNLVYSWQMQMVEEVDFEAHPSVYFDRKLVARFDAQFPSAAECIGPVLTKLKKKEQEIQAEAHEEMMKVQERREQLLALTMNAPTPATAADSPFDETYLDRDWREFAECICTGCAFQFEGQYWWGDLWVWGSNDCYLFNATSLKGSDIPNPSTKVIRTSTAPLHKDLVIIIPCDEASLSSELQEYING